MVPIASLNILLSSNSSKETHELTPQERYIRVSTNHKTPASLMEVCALDHDLSTYEANKDIIGKSIAHGIVEGLGLNWNE